MGRLQWLGHAAFNIETADGKVVLIDPFLNDNPKSPLKAASIRHADIVCVTHDHNDHLGDSVDICKRTGATFIGIYELGVYAQGCGLRDVIGMNIGGTINVKGINITMTQAFHSSLRGAPVGFIVKLPEGTLYHAGDTGLFGDMKLIGKLHKPDIAILPIGGHFTMDPVEASFAVSLIKPKTAIPCHWGTFPILTGNPETFRRLTVEKEPKVRVIILKPGEYYEF